MTVGQTLNEIEQAFKDFRKELEAVRRTLRFMEEKILNIESTFKKKRGK